MDKRGRCHSFDRVEILGHVAHGSNLVQRWLLMKKDCQEFGKVESNLAVLFCDLVGTRSIKLPWCMLAQIGEPSIFELVEPTTKGCLYLHIQERFALVCGIGYRTERYKDLPGIRKRIWEYLCTSEEG